MKTNYWEMFESNFVQLIAGLEKRRTLDVEYQEKKKACFSTAASLYSVIPAVVLCGMADKAKEFASIGLRYVQIAKETGDRRDISKLLEPDHAAYSLSYMEYYFTWFLTGVENVDLLLYSLDKIQKVASMYKRKRKYREYKDTLAQVIIIAVKSKQLAVAMDTIPILYPKNDDGNIITIAFSEARLLSFIVNSLCTNVKDFDLIHKVFMSFFDELGQGNMDLIRGYLTINDIAEISFIYHKYFSKETEANGLKPEDVIRSVRFGIN
ncbi:hypothetical protein [Geomonas anaerohicana]|uniref:Uncharacterized protein n=1 Tax=Geomonas anaerohicana TaxID=2798583 RepID=A0ABS0YGQ4_9BACT|nr:hypothetical protein [Geomonas anaerohicana]MBJ6751475.1 hypothetical protein [Geomonas anaerohicana]